MDLDEVVALPRAQEHDVRGLDVAMHDPGEVERREGVDRQEDGGRGGRGDGGGSDGRSSSSSQFASSSRKANVVIFCYHPTV